MITRRSLVVALFAGTVAATGYLAMGTNAGAAGSGKPAIGNWGFDMSAMDTSVKPGDDFFRYAGGTWMKNTQIPADRSRWGSFNILAAKSEEDIKNIIEETARRNNPKGSIEQKVADFYNSFLDTAKIDALGMKPFEADLARIATLKTHEDVVRFASEPGIPSNLPVGWGIGLDEKNPDRYAINIGQSGLGMPDRDYYLKNDPRFAETKAKYRA